MAYVVESARVLGDGVKGAAQCAETPTVNAVTMTGRIDVWSGSVNGGMDRVRRSVQ
jgi:hypothetical protein